MKNIDSNNSLRTKLKHSRVKLVPFVLAASMLSGCGAKVEVMKSSPNKLMSAILENVEDELNRQKTLDYYFSEWGYECKNMGDNFYRIVKDNNTDIIYCGSLDEFREYATVKEPTYDDIREAIVSNATISGDYEKWLLEGVNNLENSGINFDLVVLYQNFKEISLVEISSEEMMKEHGHLGAEFDIRGRRIFIDPANVSPYVICHEALGHGISDIQTSFDGKTIFYMPDFLTIYVDTETGKCSFNYLGFSLEEGKADLIADIATKTTNFGTYEMEAEQLRIITEMCGLSISDYISYGTTLLVDKMRECDVDKPFDYIKSVDDLLTSVRNREFEIEDRCRMRYNMKEFFKDYADDKITAGWDVEEIKKQIKIVFENSKYKSVEAGQLFIFDSVFMDDLEEEILNLVDDLENEKTLIKKIELD